MSWLRDWWQFAFFEPTTPVNLAVCRILVYGLLFLHNWNLDPSLWVDVDSVFWMPIEPFKRTGLMTASSSALLVMTLVWKFSLVLSCIGFLSRYALVVSAILGLYLLGLPHNYGKTHHIDSLVVLVLFIMSISRAGDYLSIDRWILKKRGKDADMPAQSGEYTWPIRLVWVLFALVFFAAGVAKERNAGLAWIFSDNMSNTLLWHHYTGHRPPTKLGITISHWPIVCRLMAALAFFAELGAPLALFSRRLRYPIVLTLFLMQCGISIMLAVAFEQYLYCYLFWVPWEKVLGFFGNKFTTPRLSQVPETV